MPAKSNYICMSRCLIYLKIKLNKLYLNKQNLSNGTISFLKFVKNNKDFCLNTVFHFRNGNKFDIEIERLSHNIKKYHVQLRSNCMAESEYTRRTHFDYDLACFYK